MTEIRDVICPISVVVFVTDLLFVYNTGGRGTPGARPPKIEKKKDFFA